MGNFQLTALRDFLERQRKLRRLSKERFAEDVLDIGKSTYYRISSDKEPEAQPDTSTIENIATGLHVKPSTLYDMISADPERVKAATELAEADAEDYLLMQLLKRVPKRKRPFVEQFINLVIEEEGNERAD